MTEVSSAPSDSLPMQPPLPVPQQQQQPQQPPPPPPPSAATKERRSSIMSLSALRTSLNGSGVATAEKQPTRTSDGSRGAEGATGSGIPSPTANQGDLSQGVKEVLSSEIGIATLLNRLKQSVSSSKEFGVFLRKRSTIEEEHANGLKRLAQATSHSMRRTEHLGGSFGTATDELMMIHERIADNGERFASDLRQMSDELMELAAMAEKTRKGWKQNGLSAEQRLVDVEAQMRKSHNKYVGLAEDYDRARTGDPTGQKGGKVFGFKGPRNAQQHEEDILRKLQIADQDYENKVLATQQERRELHTRTRPEAVKALQDTIKECDSALLMQMQKFASFNEKLLLGNGLSISPLKDQHGAKPDARSMREIVLHIDDQQDLNRYIASHRNRVAPQAGEPKYEKHPVLASTMISGPLMSGAAVPRNDTLQSPTGPGSQQHPPQQTGRLRQGSFQTSSPASQMPYNPGQHSPAGPGGPQGGLIGHGGPAYQNTPLSSNPNGSRPNSRQGLSPPQGPQHSHPYGAAGQMSPLVPQGAQQWQAPGSPAPPQDPGNSRFNHNSSPSVSQQAAPQLEALSFQNRDGPPSQSQSSYGSPQIPHSSAPVPQSRQQQASYQPPSQSSYQSPSQTGYQQPQHGGYLPPKQAPSSHIPQQSTMATGGQNRNAPPMPRATTKPVFGVPLEKLYERDGLAVPMVVYQCILAVDHYGLNMEGIYRLSGSMHHVNQLRDKFDVDSSQPNLDFRNPENFFHDVNSVAGLLKLFLRELPDPLLTVESYNGFIAAAREDDDTRRRDSLHAMINSLPDPHYATLRAVALHLYRIMENSATNRMTCSNLAIIFGPTLMGGNNGPSSTSIADAGWQVKVVETILNNTLQIFDDD